jgi:hypothetical protein
MEGLAKPILRAKRYICWDSGLANSHGNMLLPLYFVRCNGWRI